MSRDDMELLLNNVLLAFQLCLGLWQFCKLNPVGALIQGAFGWLLRPLGLSPVYSRLQHCRGRVFKKANCFALEADIPRERGDIVSCEVNTMELHYLGKEYVLAIEKTGEDSNMLYIDYKMCYYITDRIWKKLQNLERVLRYGLEGPPLARAVVTRAAASRAEAHADSAEADVRSAELDAERAESMARSARAEAERAEAERVRAGAKAELAEAEAERAKAEHGKAKAVAKRAEAEAERAKAEHEKAKAEAEQAEAEAEAERAKAEHEKAKAEIDWAQLDEAKLADAERRKAEAKANLAKAVAEAERAKAEAELAQAESAKAKAERANAECLKAAVEPARSKAAQAEAVLEAEAWAEGLAEAEARAKAKAEVTLAKDSKIEAFALKAMAMLVEAESKAKAGAEAKAKSKSRAAEAEFAVSIAGSAATRANEAMRAAKTYRAAADNFSPAARAATNSAANKAALAAAARARILDLTAAATKARADATAARSAAFERSATDTADPTLFVKGKKEFWKEVITGGVMTFKEVSDEIILYNQHVSRRLSNDWLLPVNLSVSEERLLKIFNLVALFLQTKKANVHWLIPIALSFISALLEFSTGLRKWFYTKINELFCNIMHFICDPLPRSCRRQVYSLGKWVENLAPCNDLLVKVVRGNMCAIIAEGAKAHEEGAIRVPWLETDLTPEYGVIEKQYRCQSIGIDMRCSYVMEHELCEISAPTICVSYVDCKCIEDFRHIVTLVSCVAENCCGSLICYSSNNKVCIRGFEESVISYVNNGLPSIYKLELMNVVVAGRDASD